MFTLKIHTFDTSQPPIPKHVGDIRPTSVIKSTPSNPKHKRNSFNPVQLKGVVHLFRNLPNISPATMTLFNVATRTSLVFIAAVPNYLSPQQFLDFCGSQVHYFTSLYFVRNDAVEDRYSVLIDLENQAAADGFWLTSNGERFSPSESEVCHVYFLQSLEYTDSEEVASTPLPGYTELPTCPVCLERLDHDTSSIQTTLCDHSSQCPCISKWTSLSCQVCRLCQQDDKPTCGVCGTSKNPWVCLICGFVGCGRYQEGHAIEHFRHTQHSYSLELETQQIWDYVGDKYVHRLNQSKNGSKSTMTDHQDMSPEGECGDKEDDEVSETLFSTKVDVIIDEYNFLLASQMENQRQHYETLLSEAKSRKKKSIKEAIGRAEVEKTRELQQKLEKLAKETKAVKHSNDELANCQDSLKKKYKEIQDRVAATLKSKDDNLRDLEEQIRDVKIFIQARKTLSESSDRDEIKGGTLLPVQPSEPTRKSNSKRRGRKRN